MVEREAAEPKEADNGARPREAIAAIEANIAVLRGQKDDAKAQAVADSLEERLAEIRSKDELEWLFDVDLPLVIDGKWRDKQRAVLLLPRWAHRPSAEARSWFDYVHALRTRKEDEVPKVVLVGEVRAAVLEHMGRDFVAFLHHCAFYKDRNTRRKMRAELTPAQLAIAWKLQKMIDAGMPIRVVFEKYRQAGSSWLFCQFCYWLMGFRENVGELIMAHDKDTTKEIFGYVRSAWENMPVEIRPLHQHSNKTELNLNAKLKERLKADGERGLDSHALVVTAGNDLGGTGFPTQVQLASEAGRYHHVTDVGNLMTSTGGGIQDEPWTAKIYESTAFGANTWFHKECKAAALGKGNAGWNGYCFMFIPWFFDLRNVAKVEPEMILGTKDDAEFGNEALLQRRFDLSLEQLSWRRKKIRGMPDDVRSKVDLFKQDFPSTPEEAWLHASGKALSPDLISLMRSRIEDEKIKPLFIGDLQHKRRKGPNLAFLKSGQNENEWLARRAGGPFRIYRLPDARHDYMISADCAFGIMGRDHSCMKVWQRVGFTTEHKRPMRLAAEWYGYADDDQFAHMMWRLGYFYGTGFGVNRIPAFLAWENNSAGANIAKWLRKGEDPDHHDDPYPVSRMFRKVATNKLKEKFDTAFGVSTHTTSKPIMISEFVKAAREGEVQMIGEDVDEAEALEQTEDGRIETQGADRFMSVAIGVYAAQSAPITWGVEETPEILPERDTGAYFRRLREQRLAEEAGDYSDYERVVAED